MRRTVKTKRPYDSTRRREQAAETQRRILKSARDRFAAGGWSGTTIDAIAHAASVAPETVYAAFGGKVRLLRRLVEVAVRGDDGPASLLDRRGPKAVLAEADPQRQIRMFADDIRLRLDRVAPLIDVIRSAGATDREMASLFRELQNARLRNLKKFVRSVARSGAIRRGLTDGDAGETVWALASPELYRLLTGVRGWSGERYSRWLTESLVALLLGGGS
jgi:AcrR family transcriptional regulator